MNETDLDRSFTIPGYTIHPVAAIFPVLPDVLDDYGPEAPAEYVAWVKHHQAEHERRKNEETA